MLLLLITMYVHLSIDQSVDNHSGYRKFLPSPGIPPPCYNYFHLNVKNLLTLVLFITLRLTLY